MSYDYDMEQNSKKRVGGKARHKHSRREMKAKGLGNEVTVLVPDPSEKLSVKSDWIVENLKGAWCATRVNLDGRKRMPVTDVFKFKVKSDAERFRHWLDENGYLRVRTMQVNKRHMPDVVEWAKNYANGVWLVKGVADPTPSVFRGGKYSGRVNFNMCVVEEDDAVALRMFLDGRT